nr:zinc finger BED domain-containing protein RICESLEEPER 2-like [Ipomoea batatas]
MASSLITSSVIRRRISIQRHQHRAHLPSQQTPPIELEISIKCSPEMAEHVEMDDIHKLTLLQARVSETNKENQHVMQPGNPSNDTSNKKQKQCFDKIEDKEGSQGARENLYMRCVGHDVNMKSFRDLEEISSSVAAVRAAMEYYIMMLDAAEKYERAYISYEGQDPNFTEDLLYDEDRVPNASDWETIRKTISTVDSVFQELKNSEDIQLTVLDPTQKLTFVEFVFARFYGETRGRELTEMVKEATYELFSEYKRVNSLQVSKKKIGKSDNQSKFPVLSEMAVSIGRAISH